MSRPRLAAGRSAPPDPSDVVSTSSLQLSHHRPLTFKDDFKGKTGSPGDTWCWGSIQFPSQPFHWILNHSTYVPKSKLYS